MRVILDRLELSDLEGFVDIEQRSFPFPWSRRAIEAELERGTNIAVRDAQGRLSGYLCYLSVLDERQLLNIAVAPEHRGRGIASAMLDELIRRSRADGIKRVVLEVRPSNRAAVRLYQRYGFRKTGIRPRYYSDGEEGLLMTLVLDEGQAKPGSGT